MNTDTSQRNSMAGLNDTADVNSSGDGMDTNRGDVVPSLEEVINIFSEYNALNNCEIVNNANDSTSDQKLPDGIIDNGNDIKKSGNELTGLNNQKEKDLHDPNYNLVNTRDRSSHLPLWRKSGCNSYKPAIPVIVEDTTKQEDQQDTGSDHTAVDKEIRLVSEARSKSDFEEAVACESESLYFDTSSSTSSDSMVKKDGLIEKDMLLKQQMMFRGRRHSVENVTTKKCVDFTANIKEVALGHDSTKRESTNSKLGKEEDDTRKMETNNNQGDPSNVISRKDESKSVSLPNTPRDLKPPSSFPSRSRRPRRYSLADVSNMSLSVLEDKSFAREIRQHQDSLRNRNITSPIFEMSNESGDNANIHEDQEENSISGDLTSPRERAKYLQRRRASHGTIAPILPSLHLPRSPRSSVVYRDIDTDIASQDDDGVSSSIAETNDEPTLSERENKERFGAYRRNKRRSSWACTGAYSNLKPVSTEDLLRKSSFSLDNKWGTPGSCDPYQVTVHFISDPGQADWLRNFLRPITSSIVPAQYAIFNYAERSVHVRMPDHEDEDHTKIPALAIVVFIQEEMGVERLENAQGFLKKEPWALHHRSELGPTAVPYPTNNQDYYAHANSMPLWAVRQVHCGSDRLRCQLFVSDENWSNSIQLYTTILGHGVQYQKEDFCFFNIYFDTSRNLEIQLSLKRLPAGYTPLPMEDVILQFKVVDMGSLVPLLPNVCGPISEKRWQTTDFDGNKILLLRGSEKGGKYTPRLDNIAGVSTERSTEGGESSSSTDTERPRGRQKNRRHKHGQNNLTTVV